VLIQSFNVITPLGGGVEIGLKQWMVLLLDIL